MNRSSFSIENVGNRAGCFLILAATMLIGVVLISLLYAGAILGLGIIGFAWYKRKIVGSMDKKVFKNLVLIGALLCISQAVLQLRKHQVENRKDAPIVGPIPETFRGAWASTLDDCSDRYSVMTVEPAKLDFGGGGFDVEEASSFGPKVVTLKGKSSAIIGGSFVSQKETVTLSLSDQGRLTARSSTDEGEQSPQVRCPNGAPPDAQ